MASTIGLVGYDPNSSSEEEDHHEQMDINVDITPKIMSLVSAPEVDEFIEFKGKNEFQRALDPKSKDELKYNARYDDLFAPEIGPTSNQKKENTGRNFLTGHIEQTHVNEYHFESQRRTFHCYGLAENPSDGSLVGSNVAKGLVSTSPSLTC